MAGPGEVKDYYLLFEIPEGRRPVELTGTIFQLGPQTGELGDRRRFYLSFFTPASPAPAPTPAPEKPAEAPQPAPPPAPAARTPKSPVPAPRPLNYFSGAWENTDAAPTGITKLHIRVSDSTVFIQVWGKCHPTDCDWGQVKAEPYSQGVYSPVTADTRVIVAVFKTNFSETIVTIRPEVDDNIRVDIATRFTDRSGRGSYAATYMLRRAS